MVRPFLHLGGIETTPLIGPLTIVGGSLKSFCLGGLPLDLFCDALDAV
jgi:hypothetical protein